MSFFIARAGFTRFFVAMIFDAYSQKDLTWDKEAIAYRYPTGKKVSQPELFKIIDRERQSLAKRLDDNLGKAIAGSISLEDWQRSTALMIKDAHIDMARLGRGGKESTFAYHYLQVGNHLRTIEYPALRRFASDLREGKLSEKQARDRMSKYALATKASFEKANLTLREQSGQHYGRRRLGNCKNHCQPCIGYSLQGWLPLSQVVPPGVDCLCGGRCCCSVETRKFPPIEAR